MVEVAQHKTLIGGDHENVVFHIWKQIFGTNRLLLWGVNLRALIAVWLTVRAEGAGNTLGETAGMNRYPAAVVI